MNYLLDTNVVSEWVRPRPDAGVVTWLADVDEDRVFMSVVTLAELRYGVERLDPGRRRDRLEEWLRDDLPLRFEGRILQIDARIAEEWGRIAAIREVRGRPIGVMDAFIAATAETYALTLVTRNTADFENSVTLLFNPWTGRDVGPSETE